MFATMLRETPSYGAYFASYDYFCRVLIPDGNFDEPSLSLLLAGGLAGVVKNIELEYCRFY